MLKGTTTIEQTEEQTEQKPKEWTPRILGILCNWCSYAGADLAGSSRIQYPPNVRVIRVPCSGRVNPQYVLKAFQKGFEGVLVLGCHPGDCHYAKGNYYARRRLMLLTKFLPSIGIEPERFHFQWVSASEGVLFAEVVAEMTKRLEALGPFSGIGLGKNADERG
ncbi:MAG: hydrogenase iron-sulfur subunit [Armatimonadota bacterium]|nr:hydrogenase iron-sulfur subunit [Armatimonadota bacterium]